MALTFPHIQKNSIQFICFIFCGRNWFFYLAKKRNL